MVGLRLDLGQKHTPCCRNLGLGGSIPRSVLSPFPLGSRTPQPFRGVPTALCDSQAPVSWSLCLLSQGQAAMGAGRAVRLGVRGSWKTGGHH